MATGEEIPAWPTPDNATGGTLPFSGNIQGGGFIPVPKEIIGRNTADPIQTVEFTLINFPRFYGSHGDRLWTHKHGKPVVVPNLMSVDLNAGSWEVHIVEKPNRNDVFKKLVQEGGYGPTHHGWITRSDDKTFAAKEVQVLVDALALFLSFARGLYCGIAQLLGTDQNDEPVWEQWSISNVEPWRGTRSWFDNQDAQALEVLFPSFWDSFLSWGNDERSRIALEWYLASNEQKADYFNDEIEPETILELIRLYFAPTPTTTPSVALVIDSEVTVTGYWSDGSANVEVTVSLRNEGNLQLSSPVQVAVRCSQDGETVDDCGGVMRVTLSDGFSPASGALTLRVPPSDLSLTFTYGEDGSTVVNIDSIDVPERIVGVDRDVWACFSDKSNLGTSFFYAGEGIGCAAWPSETIEKWDQTSPVKVWTYGRDSFIEVLKNSLDKLKHVLGLDFEYVSTKDEAALVAYIGYTDAEAESPDVEGCLYAHYAGCASRSANELGMIERGRISVRNPRETEFHELADTSQVAVQSTILHEAIHALASMEHRAEPDSIMNNGPLRRPELSPMDRELLKLHASPLVKPGMAMAEIESLIVFNDELIDPHVDANLTKWKLASNAYRVLRQAESATFKVRSSLPDCNEEFGQADYAVFNLDKRGWHHSFRWVMIDYGLDHFYTFDETWGQEYWHRSSEGWLQVTSRQYADATPGWRRELTDPHYMIENVLRHADWTDATIVVGQDGLATLEFELDTLNDGRLDVLIVLDPETGVISEYSMDWERGDDACGRYRAEAEDGEYHSTFEFPDAVREGSGALGDCDIEQLGPISGVVSLSETFRRHCGSGTDGYLRSYGFSVADWSYVRVEASSANSIALQLLEGSGSGELSVDQHVHIAFSTDHEFIWDHWAQAIVPPGQYIVEIVSHNRVLDEFGLALHTSETHPPPHSFESISSGHDHACALASDGLAFCWGGNGELYAWPPNGEVSMLAPPGEEFIAVSSATFYSCGLKADGTPVCWGRAYSGQTMPPAGEKFVSISSGQISTCALRHDGTAACWGWDIEGQASPPMKERFASISSGERFTCALRMDGTVYCWGGGFVALDPEFAASDPGLAAPPPEDERFSSISSGGLHICALRPNGTAVCWGEDNRGQASPPDDERFTTISSGFRHTCALRMDGSAVCWGRDSEGQTSPPADEKFVSISSGGHHTCALRQDGTVACWGSNHNGEPSSPFP